MHSTESRFVIGHRTIKNTVCRHVCVHFSAQKFYRVAGWGSEGVNEYI